MANKAVFLDRDNTIMEDPGYLSDPGAVKLLPGVELALKSLKQAGFKIVVVTNQSGVARGILTEETLENIHAELRRQLAEKGTHLDAIYYCPFHPEGNVEKYTKESDLSKPQPGMLLKAAEEMDIDLKNSWMVGDSPRDIEAGQRANCRTVRVRTKPSMMGEVDEDVQADFTVRNLVDAAKVILRNPAKPKAVAKPAPSGPTGASSQQEVDVMADTDIRKEILRHVRQLARSEHAEEFSILKLVGGIVQVLALLSLIIVFWKMLDDKIDHATLWALIAVVLQVMALTFFTVHRPK